MRRPPQLRITEQQFLYAGSWIGCTGASRVDAPVRGTGSCPDSRRSPCSAACHVVPSSRFH